MFRDTLYCYLNHKSATVDIIEPNFKLHILVSEPLYQIVLFHWFLRIGYLIFRLNNALKEAGCSRVWQPWQVACWSGRHAAVSGNVSIFISAWMKAEVEAEDAVRVTATHDVPSADLRVCHFDSWLSAHKHLLTGINTTSWLRRLHATSSLKGHKWYRVYSFHYSIYIPVHEFKRGVFYSK